MTGFLALYAKELREIRTSILILVLGTLLLYAYILTSVTSEAGLIFLSVLPIWGTLLILPFILVHGFTVEWRGMTHYTLLSLPLPRWVLAAAKILAVFTAGLGVASVAAGGILLLETPMPTAAALLQQHGTTPRSVMLFGCGQYLAFLVLCLGVAMGGVGVGHATRRWRGPAVAAFLLTGLYLFFSVLPDFWQIIGGGVGIAWTSLLYPFSFGTGLLVLGLVFFDRGVDV